MTTNDKVLMIIAIMILLTSTHILLYTNITKNLLVEIQQDISNLTVEYNNYSDSTIVNNSYYELVSQSNTYSIVEQYHFNRKNESYCSGKRISGMTKLFIYGNSMNPTIFHDDDVFVVEFRSHENAIDLIQEGDILAVYTDDTKEEIIIHRLVGIYPEHFIMKGDNNPRFDGEWLDYDLIMGVVCAWQRT